MSTKNSFFTDVSDLAHELNPKYHTNGYSKVFVGDRGVEFFIARLAVNVNEDFEAEEGVYLVEVNVVDKQDLSDTLTDGNVHQLLVDDDFDNWEYETFYNSDDALVFIHNYN